jgi:hypothetical protein
MVGVSWHRGCPVRISDLRRVELTHWGFDGVRHGGELIVQKDVARSVVDVFHTLYSMHFPIRAMLRVDRFGADDNATMAADNTSAFNCRRAVAAGPPTWSRHAYGKGIDVNTVENPYLFGKKVLPPAGKKFTGRSKAKPGLIRHGDKIYKAFKKAGFRWGGSFSNPDYQHFDL